PAGVAPCPHSTWTLPVRTEWKIPGTSPAGPTRWGSTTCSVKALATQASKALPPRSSMAMPTAVASQCVDVTTPKVPVISGRVVNMVRNRLFLLFGQGNAFQADEAIGIGHEALHPLLQAEGPGQVKGVDDGPLLLHLLEELGIQLLALACVQLLAGFHQQVVHGLVAEFPIVQAALAGNVLEYIGAGVDPARPAGLCELEIAAGHGRLQGREPHGPQCDVEARLAAHGLDQLEDLLHDGVVAEGYLDLDAVMARRLQHRLRLFDVAAPALHAFVVGEAGRRERLEGRLVQAHADNLVDGVLVQ